MRVIPQFRNIRHLANGVTQGFSPVTAEILRVPFILRYGKFNPASAGLRQIPHPPPDLPLEGGGA